MRSFSRLAALAAIVALVFAAAACGPKPTIVSSGPNDTPKNNYDQGMALLDKGDNDGALTAFQRSVGLDPKFAPGHCGVALAQSAKGNHAAAETAVGEARRWGGSLPDVDLTYGRILAAQGKHKEAIDAYGDSLGKGVTADAHHYRGVSYEKLSKYDEAEKDFGSAVKVSPDHAKANAAWKNLQTARRVSVGGPAEYEKIAHADSVTRADVAALLCKELEVDKVLRAPKKGGESKFEAPKGPMEKGGAASAGAAAAAATDLEGNWASEFAGRCVSCGAMECYPDRTFKPAAKMNRAELSMVLVKVLARGLGDDSIETKFLGQTSPFPDVPSTHFAFSSIMVTTTRGILKAKTDGKFGLNEPVTGADALDAVRSLKIALK